MQSIQNTYPEKLDKGRPGGIVNAELSNLISRNVETAAGIGFGVVVQRGTNDDQIAAFAGGTPLGITVRERSTNANTPDKFAQYDSARVMTKGPIFVNSAEAVTAGNGVFVDNTTGALYNATAAGRTQLPNAVWDTTTSAAGLAVVALDIR